MSPPPIAAGCGEWQDAPSSCQEAARYDRDRSRRRHTSGAAATTPLLRSGPASGDRAGSALAAADGAAVGKRGTGGDRRGKGVATRRRTARLRHGRAAGAASLERLGSIAGQHRPDPALVRSGRGGPCYARRKPARASCRAAPGLGRALARPAADHGHRQRDSRQLLRWRRVPRAGAAIAQGRALLRGRRRHSRCRRRVDAARRDPGRAGRGNPAGRAGGARLGSGRRGGLDRYAARGFMEAALAAGARIINDVAALDGDPRALAVCRRIARRGRAHAYAGRAADDAAQSHLPPRLA